MKKRNQAWLLPGWILMGVLLGAHADDPAQTALEATRQTLRQQGFKTDLSDFNLTTAPQMQAREAIIEAAAPDRMRGPLPDSQDLMQTVGSNAAMVVWQLDSLKRPSPSWPDEGNWLSWADFQDEFGQTHPELDDAAAAILAAPIRFNLRASDGGAMRLPHLALMKRLLSSFGSRTMLALHDGDREAAWTNVLAATRLVTAWEPEPAEVSHLVRFENTTLAFNLLWQALQTNGWTEAQLDRLQMEWAAVDFFTNLPSVIDFKCASDVARLQDQISHPHPAFKRPNLTNAPTTPGMGAPVQRPAYSQPEAWEDEKSILLFYWDREQEIRNAIQMPTWSIMRLLPGVLNAPVFQPPHPSLAQIAWRFQNLNRSRQLGGLSLLGHAAEAEARRQIIVTALALERYHGKYGAYPESLAALAPQFLKNPPVDFMDGQPLRYRLAESGHFILYSVGLDGVDDGGLFIPHDPAQDRMGYREATAVLKGDLIWPLSAPADVVAAIHKAELAASAQRADQSEEMQALDQWGHTDRHQREVARLLAAPAPGNLPDPDYHGQPLSESLRNPATAGTNRLTLDQMLTLRQIPTNSEPATVVLNCPSNWNLIDDHGQLFTNDEFGSVFHITLPDSGRSQTLTGP